MNASLDFNKIATDLIVRYSASFFERLTEFSRSQINSLRAFVGVGLPNLIVQQLNQVGYISTFLSPDQRVPFLDAYVNLYLSAGTLTIRDDDIVSGSFGTKLLVLGSAGSGKSMFSKYMVHCFSRNSNRVPILIELRNYNGLGAGDLIDLIFKITCAGQALSRDLFIALIKRGGFVFLLDGLDEVDFDRRTEVEAEIDSFTQRFDSNIFIVTSRPADKLPSWLYINSFRIQPLSSESLKLLVQKSIFDEETKAQFVAELPTLERTHGSFLANPLLVTIMLLLFKDTIKIPLRKNVFYSVAFDVLFYRHDSYKPGRFIRKRRTNLPLTDFRGVFSVFCALTYSVNRYTFYVSELVEYLVQSLKYWGVDASPEDLRVDLQESLAMIQADGLRYAFSHRSFQEYFTALFISVDAYVDKFSFIDQIVGRQDTDSVLDLLYEINRGRIENDWVVPFLKNILTDLDGNIEGENYIEILHALFGEVALIAKNGRLWLCASSEGGGLSGLAFIDRIYKVTECIMQPDSIGWNDRDVLDRISRGAVGASEGVKASLSHALEKASVTIVESFVSKELKLGKPDNEWVCDVAIYIFALEKISVYKRVLQALERKSHEKVAIEGLFFKK